MTGAPRRRLVPSAIVVTAYGVLLGVVAWNTYFGHVAGPQVLRWTGSWIAPAGGPASQAYFRKQIHLPDGPRRAWIQISAPDEYVLYVNGWQVDRRRGWLRNVSDVYDISAHLEPGPNVVAVAVSRHTHPGTSRLLVESEYEGALGHRMRMVSDPSWKVSLLPARQPSPGPLWYERGFDDAGWPRAEAVGAPRPEDRTRLRYPPWVVTGPLDDYWVWSRAGQARTAYFRGALPTPGGTSGVWLRVATTGGYVVLVNGVAVAERPWASEQVPETSVPALTAYDITPFVRRGSSLIAIRSDVRGAGRRLYVDALVMDRSGSARTVAMSGSWKASTSPRPGWASVGHDDSDWPAAVRLERGLAPSGPLERRLVPTMPPLPYRLTGWLTWSGFVLLVVAGALGSWLLAARGGRRIRGGDLDQALARAAGPYGLGAAALLLALLLGTDARLDRAFPYQSSVVAAALAVLLLGQLVSWLPVKTAAAPAPPLPRPTWRPAGLPRAGAALLVGLFMVGGLLLRLHEIDYRPLNSDESAAMFTTLGILEKGYPHHRISELIAERRSHSSELVGYPKALTIWLFGPEEFGARLPAAIFGTLAIPLVYLAGRALFDRRVGLLASLIIAVLPAAISFSQYARYPAQLSVFALWMVHLFHAAIRAERVDARRLYLAVGAFVLTYLSWEPAVLLLPGLFVGLLAVKRRDLGWIREKHLWIAVAVAALVIFFQQSARIIDQAGQMPLRTGYRDVALSLLWLSPHYDPLALAKSLLFMNHVQVISALMLVGLIASVRQPPWAYLNAVLFVPILLITNLLEAHRERHVYYLMPLVILSGTRAVFFLLDALLPLVRGPGPVTRLTRWVAVGLVLLSANDHVLKLYNMPGYLSPFTISAVGGDGWIRSAAAFVRGGRGPEEPVVARQPILVYHHLGRADYLLRSVEIPAAVADVAPIPVDIRTGVRAIFNRFELEQLLNGKRSAWIVTPASFEGVDREMVSFLEERARLVFEDERMRVLEWRR